MKENIQTIVTIIGEGVVNKQLKPIEFHTYLSYNGLILCTSKPKDWRHVELIAFGYTDNLDLMFAYDNDRVEGICVLGKFNDGVV